MHLDAEETVTRGDVHRSMWAYWGVCCRIGKADERIMVKEMLSSPYLLNTSNPALSALVSTSKRARPRRNRRRTG